MLLDFTHERVARREPFVQDDKRLDDFGARCIGHPDDSGHAHGRMAQQAIFDRSGPDAIAGARDDIVVAADDATFGVPEVDRGAMGGGAHLQRLFPVQKVRMMYFTGEPITAAEAHRLGAIETVVPRGELREAALAIARKIAAKSTAMIRLAKESLNGIEDGNLEDKYRWEQGFTLQAYSEKDSAETRRAFVEKRDANFK